MNKDIGETSAPWRPASSASTGCRASEIQREEERAQRRAYEEAAQQAMQQMSSLEREQMQHWSLMLAEQGRLDHLLFAEKAMKMSALNETRLRKVDKTNLPMVSPPWVAAPPPTPMHKKAADGANTGEVLDEELGELRLPLQ